MVCTQRHFAIVLDEDVAEFPELFGAVADAYLEKRMYTEALEVYQDMAENDEVRFFAWKVQRWELSSLSQTNGPPVWIKVGQCHQAMGDLEDARDCYEAGASFSCSCST